MAKLKLKSGNNTIRISEVDADNEVNIEIKKYIQPITYINKQQAIQIISHLQEQFKIK